MRFIEEVFSNSDLVGEIIRNGIEKTSSLIKAFKEAYSLNIKLGKKLSNERIRDLAIEALGFKINKKISPFIVCHGFFELSYMDNECNAEYYFWNEFVLLMDFEMKVTIYNEKKEILLEQESFFNWVSSENYLVLYFDTSLSLYTHKCGKVIKILEKQVLPSFSLLHQMEIVETKNGDLMILASTPNNYFAFKFKDGFLRDFLKGELDGNIVIFYPDGELHLGNQMIHGLGYEGVYIGDNIYHYDSNKSTVHNIRHFLGFNVLVWKTLELIILFDDGCLLVNGEDRNILWRGKEGIDEHKIFVPPFIILGEDIYDLETREKLLNLSSFLGSKINGISLKRDGTGYVIWISPKPSH